MLIMRQVVLLCRRGEVADAINTTRHNPKYLADFELPAGLTAECDAAKALAGAAFIVHCIPIQSTREFLLGVAGLIPSDAVFVSTSKVARIIFNRHAMASIFAGAARGDAGDDEGLDPGGAGAGATNGLRVGPVLRQGAHADAAHRPCHCLRRYCA